MDREELGGRTEPHELPEAEHGEERFPQDDAAGRYDGGVLEELEAHQFFHPQSVRWYRSLFSDRNPDEGRDLGDVEFLHDRGWVVECGDGLAPTRAAVLVFGRARYVRQALPRPVIDCQFIGAGAAAGRGWSAVGRLSGSGGPGEIAGSGRGAIARGAYPMMRRKGTPSSSTSAASTSTPIAYAHDQLPTRTGEEPRLIITVGVPRASIWPPNSSPRSTRGSGCSLALHCLKLTVSCTPESTT